MKNDTLNRLQQWYHGQCNSHWEHQHGVTITTLDNPGWMIEIDLEGTSLESKSFQTVIHEEATKLNWYHCEVRNLKFHCTTGPDNLKDALNIFLDWADGA